MDSDAKKSGLKLQLSLGARPRSLDSLIGQQKAIIGIRGQLQTKRPKGWLFSGPKGTGKTSAARIVALTYQCEHQDVVGKPCKACWRAWSTFPIYEIPGANITTLEKMRPALAGVNAGLMGAGAYRVYIINECQRCSVGAMDLFLEYLEDTPPTTVFIFTTTEPWEISTAVQSRCQCYSFRELDIDEVEKLVLRLLRREGSTLPADRLVEALSERHVASPRFICQAVDKYVGGCDPEEAAEVTAAEEVDVEGLMRSVMLGSWPDASRFLLQSQRSDVRSLRRNMILYLRKTLLETSEIGPRGDALEKAIATLGDLHNAETSVVASVISAKLYRLCAVFQKYPVGGRTS